MARPSININIQTIKKLYEDGRTTQSIATELNVGITTINNRLKQTGVKLRSDCLGRKLSLNEDYFTKVDTQDKAYILGVIYADGYNKGNGLSIGLQKKDADILDFIKDSMEAGTTIKDYGANNDNYLRLDISSTKISKNLDLLGAFRCKSLTLKFPTEEQVPKHLQSHFIRGYFDGDGSVSLRTYRDGRSKKGIVARMVETYEFLTAISNILQEKFQLKDRKLSKHTKSEGVYYLIYTGSKVVRFIYNYLYKNASFCMNRKYEIFKSYFDNE